MKRINNKGFTLVELLAVIIILAIVVGITIPAVLTMVDNARERAGDDAAAVVADWVDKQYSLRIIGFGGVDTIFETVCFPSGSSASTCAASSGKTITSSASGNTDNDNFIKAAGLTPNDIEYLKITIGASDRSCVELKAKSSGNFYINRAGATNIYKSVNCS